MTATNPETAAAATEATRLRLRRPMLLGTFGSEEARGALLSLADGSVLRAFMGDDTPAGRITAIAPGAVHLAVGLGAQVLELPGS